MGRGHRVFSLCLVIIFTIVTSCLAFAPARRLPVARAAMSVFASGSPSGPPSSPAPRWRQYASRTRVEGARPFPADLGLSFTDIRCTQKRIKCYVLSDLHADAEKNQVWVRENCRRLEADRDVFTIFLLPGDVGSEIDRLQSVFRVLVANFDAVVFCPGNHEAWKRGTAAGGSATQPHLRADNRMAVDSVEKIVEVVECAKECGVYVGPIRVEREREGGSDDAGDESTSASSSSSSSAIAVFPLYSWYHASWDDEPDLINDVYLAVEEVMPFQKKWGDFSMCSWPDELGLTQAEWATTVTTVGSTVLAEAFAAINEKFLVPPGVEDEGGGAGGGGGGGASRRGLSSHPSVQESDTVISFSHFLPRQELCPEKRYLIEPLLSRVIGSDPLEAQVRRLNPHLHCFGHTHIPIDLELDGIRYLQWPLGYYREADKQCAPIHAVGPLLVYDSACGVGAEAIPKKLPSLSVAWSQYYKNNPRRPTEVTQLAPWVMARLDSFSGLVKSNSKQRQP